MVGETVADQQLPFHVRVPVAAPIEIVAAGLNDEEHPTHRRRHPVVWVPALAAMLILSALAVLGVSRHYKTRSVSPTHLQTTTQSTPSRPAMTSATTEEITAGSPRTETFEITVRAQESLSDIAVRHLGSFDRELLHKIQLLNPNITDPDIIQPGQKIRIPKRSIPSGVENLTSSNARNLR